MNDYVEEIEAIIQNNASMAKSWTPERAAAAQKIYEEARDKYIARQQYAAQNLAKAQASASAKALAHVVWRVDIGDSDLVCDAACGTLYVGDTGDETESKPSIPLIEEVYTPVETEAERTERLWNAVKEFSSN